MKKRMLSLFLAVLMLVGMIPIAPSAHAASTLEEAMKDVSVYAHSQKLNWLTMNGSVKEQEYTYYLYQSLQTGETKEIPAYCVDPRLYGVPWIKDHNGSVDSIRYSAESTVSDPKLVGIISNGYPHMTLNDLGLQSVDEAYYATKTAVWIYLLGNWTISGLGINPNLSGADKEAAQRVLQATKTIYQRGMYWNEMVSPKLTATPDKSTAYAAVVNGQECYQQVFVIDSDTWALTPVKLSLDEGAPAGTKIMSMDNDEISQIKLSTERTSGAGYQAKVKVVYPKSAVEGQTGTCQLILNASVVEYKLFYAHTLESDQYGNLQNYILDTDPDTPATATAISSYSAEPDTPDDPKDPADPQPSALTIYKYEEGTQAPLSGAVFEVFYPNGERLGSFTTPGSGTVTIPVTIYGNYSVTELVAPENHLLPEIRTQRATVTALSPGIVTFWNAPYGNLRVHKVSNTGDNLNGATIQIKNLETGETQTAQTAAGGVAEFTHLKPGGYEVREIAGIAGYVADTETTKTVTVVTGQTSEVTFVNTEKPGLRIAKYDRITNKTMADVSFEIWKDGVSIGRYTTDQMGEIVLNDAEPGTYVVQEIQGPNSHITDPTPQQIELKAGDGVKQMLFYNDQKPGIHLIKVDSENLSKVIPNVKFRIAAVNGTWGPKEYTTDLNGEIDLSELPTGAYTVTELSVPEGYLIDNGSRIIELAANTTAEFVFTNTKKPVIEVVKYDSNTGKYLAGATFRIAKIEDASHYLDRVTDTQGRIRIENMEPGIYSVQELAAPSGYVLNSTEYHVELFPGKTSELVVENEKKPDLKIIKFDAVTGEPITGATFTVRKIDSSTLLTETTDRNGEILLTGMDPGVYEITEQSVPNEYLLDPIPQKITLEPNKMGTVQFQDYPKPTLLVRKIDSVTGKPLEGARFQVTYGSNHTFTGEVNDLGEHYTDANGEILLEKLRDGWYKVQELEAPSGYRIKDDGIQECYIAAGRSKVLTFENIPLSTILIQKMDEETGKPLAGAAFRVKYLNSMTSMDGTTLGDYITDQNGSIELTGLDEGTYVIDELSAPAGYILNAANTRTVYLSGEDQDFISLIYGNQKMGSLLIVKKDAVTGAPLSGVEFFVTDSDGAVVGNGNGSFTTDYSGSILIPNLEPGKTIVAKETRSISGYILDDAPQTAKIKANETVTLEFRDQPKGSLIVQKIDAATGESLSGAEFKITMANGELTPDNEGLTSSNGIYRTDSNGQVVLEKLTPATYVVTETKAPDGYVMHGEPVTVVVNAADTQTVTVANPPKGSLIVEKYDKASGERLPGAKFKIVTANGELVADNQGLTSTNGLYSTDENGQIVLSKLAPQTYVVTEIEAPEGYQLDSVPQTVVVHTDDVQTLRFYDEPLASLTIIKRDADTHELLPGAAFAVKDGAGNTVGDKDAYVTGSDGSVTLTGLTPNMTVVVSEETAPAGYWNGSPLKTAVLKSGVLNSLTFENQKLGTLLIKKYVEGTNNEPLSGVGFKVTSSDGSAIGPDDGTYYTDRAGQIELSGLQPGITVNVREFKTVDGFVLDGTPQDIVIKGGQTQSLTFWNAKKQTLTINKYVAGTTDPIAGVRFQVTASDGSAIGTNNGEFLTDRNGQIKIDGLTPGVTITAREIETVSGFVLDSAPQSILIKAGEAQTLNFYNQAKGTLIVEKRDSITNAVLADAEFRITTIDGAYVDDNEGATSTQGIYKTDAHGQIVLRNLQPNTYVITETKAPEGYVLDSETKTVKVNADDAQTIVFTNTPKQTVVIQKYADGTTTPLEGVRFFVTDANGNPISGNGMYVTDANGRITITGLEPGTTLVARETRTVKGYALNSTPQTIQVTANSSMLHSSGTPATTVSSPNQLTFYDDPLSTLVLHKYIAGTANEPLAGVAFRVTDGTGADVGPGGGVYYSDAKGEVVLTDLEPGMTVIAREIKTVDGFVLDGTPQRVTLKSGEVSDLTFWNAPVQSLIIKKYASGTTDPIQGVRFKVTASDGKVVGSSNGEFLTNENGEIVLTGLTPGVTVTAQEIETGSGFVLDTTPKSIKIESGEAQSLVFYNQRKGGIIIEKQDEQTGAPLAGAEFRVTTSGGVPVDADEGRTSTDGVYATNANGQIVLTNLSPDTYIITETKAPEGYVVAGEKQTVKVNANDTQTVKFTNVALQSVTIQKLAEGTNKPLAGVTFLVTDANNAPIGNGSYVTDENGQITLTGLTPGMALIIRETKTVKGYQLNSTPRTIVVGTGTTALNAALLHSANTATAGTNTVSIYDEPLSTLVIKKYIKGTDREPLEGVAFKVTDGNGGNVGPNDGVWYTNNAGEITIPDLETGAVITVREIATVDGYILDGNPKQVQIKSSDVHELVFWNAKQGALTIRALDSATQQSIEGVTFKITTATGEFVPDKNGKISSNGLYKTDKAGEIILTGVVGTFVVSMVDTVPGYSIHEATRSQTIVVNPDDTQQLTAYCDPLQTLTVQVFEKGTTNPLAGIPFKVTSSDGKVVGEANGEYVSDRNGQFTVTGIAPGVTITAQEVGSISGYVLNSVPQSILIKSGEAQKLTFFNEKKGTLIVKLKDAASGAPIANAEFKITTILGAYVDDNEGATSTKGAYRTDENGEIRLLLLNPDTFEVTQLTTDGSHAMDSRSQTVKVNAADAQTIEFKNTALESVVIQKYVEGTTKPLAGVTFLITDGNGAPISGNGEFVTDKNGRIVLAGLIPGTTLIVKEIKTAKGYVLNTQPQTIVVGKANSVTSVSTTATTGSTTPSVTAQGGSGNTLTFYDDPLSTLVINKYVTGTTRPIKGVRFLITDSTGAYVGTNNGEYRTDANGQIILRNLEPGITITAKEIEAASGYVLDTTPKSIEIKTGEVQRLDFYNSPEGGLELIKVNASDKTKRIENVTFEIRRMDGGLVETVTTGKNGRVHVNLDAGSYYAVEIAAAKGYKLDNTPQYFEIKDGRTTTLTVANTPYSGIEIHKVDSVTGEGIYGAKFLLYDAEKHPVGEYVSDQNGYVYVNDLTRDGKYFIRELECEGYNVDTQMKTITLKAGEIIQIEWKNDPITGQIQVYKYAAEYNAVTGTAAGAPLSGAVYEIVDVRSGKVVDNITTDARGVAASKALPLKRYQVKEVTAPAYWQVDATVHDVTLEYPGQIIKLSAYDKPATLGVKVSKRGNASVMAGQQMKYTITVANTSNVALDNFYWHDRIPTDIAVGTVLTTGTYSARLNYRILYKTNYSGDYQVLASNLLTANNYSFSLNAIPTQTGEIVTEVLFEFGKVPAGFQSVTAPTLSVCVNGNATNGYTMVNRADAGGKYGGTWETGNASWTTQIIQLTKPAKLPKTGY